MMYTIRNASEKTKNALNEYAATHDITVAEALQQLIEFGVEYYEQHKKNPKKYVNAQDALKVLPGW